MVVAKISRVKSEDSSVRSVAEGFFIRGHGRTMLVCTYIDQLGNTCEITNYSQRQRNKHGVLLDELQELEKKSEALSAKYRKSNRAERNDMFDDVEETQFKLSEAKVKEQVYRIMTRNQAITKDLQEKYSEYTKDPYKLPVFCISNTAYEKHQTGYSKRDPPVLDLQGTGLPALRRYLKLTPAQGRFNDIRFVVNQQLPSLLASFELWCAKTHMKRKKEIEDIVTEPQSTYIPIIEGFFNRLITHVEQHILLIIKHKDEAWTEKAKVLSSKWARESTATYLGLLRKDGYRKATKVKHRIDWNEELIAIMAADLQQGFKDLVELCKDLEHPFMVDLRELIDVMKRKIQGKMADLLRVHR